MSTITRPRLNERTCIATPTTCSVQISKVILSVTLSILWYREASAQRKQIATRHDTSTTRVCFRFTLNGESAQCFIRI